MLKYFSLDNVGRGEYFVAMSIKSPSCYMHGPSADPLLTELKVYLLARFKHRLARLRPMFWIRLMMRVDEYSRKDLRLLINSFELQLTEGLEPTGQTDQNTISRFKEIFPTKRDSTIVKMFEGDQYKFREELMKVRKVVKPKVKKGRIKTWQ